jgi:hypothetical protein
MHRVFWGRTTLLATLFCFINLRVVPLVADPAPRVTEKFMIESTMSVDLMRPPIASSDYGFLVCWERKDSETTTVLALRFDRKGNALDSAPLIIGENIGRFQVSSDGRDFLIAWFDSSRVSNRIVRRDGTVTEPTATVQLDQPYRFEEESALVFGGGSYVFLAFVQQDVLVPHATMRVYEIAMWRFGNDGKVLDPSGTILGWDSQRPYRLRAAGSRRGAFAVWQRTHGLSGMCIDQNDGISIGTLSANAWSDGTPVVASNDHEYFVVWRDPQRLSLLGARIAFDGKIISTDNVLVEEETDWPALCRSEHGWLLSWMTRSYSTNTTILATELRRDGTQRTAPFVLEETARPFVLNAAAVRGKGKLVITGRETDSENLTLVAHIIK